jgi:filamentous hemagglutinin family protein
VASIVVLSEAFASPSGGVVTSGGANIAQSGTTTTINQTTNKASINWNSFNVAQNESVVFNQPSTSAITLNRVVGNERSVIDGAINANGQVWILNTNGVLFGKNASINTSGLLATTAKLSDSDFNSGNYIFSNMSQNSVINRGSIEIANSGSVILASKEVANEGKIKAIKGKVHLIGANEYSINLNGNSLINLTINKGTLDAMVQNSGTIVADGGEIYLSTNAVNDLLKGVVNNSGVIEANSMDNLLGKVELFAHGGEVQVSGTIEANGGFVETSGKDFAIDKNTKVSAKTWLIDPTDIVVDDASAYVASLNSGTDVTIQTSDSGTEDGDITIKTDIDWDTTATLTLDADGDIHIYSTIDAIDSDGTNHGSVVLTYGGDYDFGLNYNGVSTGFAGKIRLGSSSSFTDNGVAYTVITTLGSAGSTTGTDLQGIYGDLTKNYVLGTDIDASATSTWNAGSGFLPLSNGITADPKIDFTGNFNGLGNVISNLTIQRSATNYIALFGQLKGSTVNNVGLTNVNIKGAMYVGALTASTYSSAVIKNVYSTGLVSSKGTGGVGGLVGFLMQSNMSNTYSTATVSADGIQAGGLVGNVAWSSVLSSSYATGDTSGTQYIGGLVGTVDNSGEVENCYATGDASGTTDVGGLVGTIMWGNTIKNSYATGTATASVSNQNGFIGRLVVMGSVSDSFWDVQTSTLGSSGDNNEGATGKTTTDMKEITTFENANWDIAGSGGEYPTLTFGHSSTVWKSGDLSTNVYLRLLSTSSTYGSTPTLSYGIYDSATGGNLITDAGASGSAVWSTTLDATSSAGTYNLSYSSGISLSNSGYILNAGDSTSYTISPKAITIKATDLSKIYGDSEPTLSYTITNGALVNGDTFSGILARSRGEIANIYTISQGTLALDSNYDLTFENGEFTIIPRVESVNTKVIVPSIVAPTIKTTTPKTTQLSLPDSVALGFDKGKKVALVSKPIENEPTKKITMTQITQIQNSDTQETKTTNAPSVQEVRVPLSQNSIVELVNGGVNLPEGVEQEFYIVEDRNSRL